MDREVSENDVVLYMKGTPRQPMCGFSAKAAKLLHAYEVPFHAVNVLEEEDKREGIKEFGDWPTIPQLYVAGELVGGSDILMEMHESGELAELFEDEDIETAVGGD
ncbi:MAG: Grx4 family monothiol glutaredoxin [Bradymonadaceae bacterium]